MTGTIFSSPETVELLSPSESSPPEWENRMMLRSTARNYDPGHYMGHISSTPLLMVVDEDTVTITDLALCTYEAALENKRLVMVRGRNGRPTRTPSTPLASPPATGSSST